MKVSLNIVRSFAVASLSLLIFTACSQENPDGESIVSGSNVYEVSATASGSTADGTVDFTWGSEDGTTTFREFVDGKKHVVNIWGTWCPPCRKELPDLVEFSKSNSDIRVVGIALERTDDPVKGLQEFCNEYGVSYLNVTGKQEVLQPLVTQFGRIEGVPTTLFFNSDGSLSKTIVGATDFATFNQHAQELH